MQYRDAVTMNARHLAACQRGEIIDGKLYLMTPPNTEHQRLIFRLARRIADFIDARQEKSEVFLAPFSVFLREDESSYVEPDISVVCDPGKVDENGCKGAPDWIIEIVSPYSYFHDHVRKANAYQLCGVREYWIVDPLKKLVTQYLFSISEEQNTYSFDQPVAAEVIDGLILDFSQFKIM